MTNECVNKNIQVDEGPTRGFCYAMPDSRFPPIAITVLLIACICIYGIILDPSVTFAGMDFLNLNYPRAVLTKDAYANGVLPLWNWFEWGGAPLMAALQGAVFYPPTWLALMIPLPYGLQLFVFMHLLAAGLGAYLVARQMGKLPAPSAAVAGIMFMGSSFYPGRIEQFQIVAVNCLLPWLVLSVYHASRFPRRFILLPVTWALTLLAGHPQYALFNILAAVLFTTLLFPWRHLPFPVRGLVALAAGTALGTGLAALQLLPTWELGQLSERIWPYPDPTQPELHWQHLPALFVPKYYQLRTGETGRIFGFTELGLYIGVLAVPLALSSLLRMRKNARRMRRFTFAAGIIWLAAMVFALGTNGYLAPLFFKYIPFFTQSRGAARSLNVASLMLALLAGQGLTTIFYRSGSFSRTKAHVLGLAVALSACADLTLNHFSEIKAVLTPVKVLAAKPLHPADESLTGRVYRFTANDSDLYLNNAPAAAAERIIRLQPNLSSVLQISLIDGYEEGLLPVRSYANLQRRYNRNLRSDSPDAALLAFLGSNLMFTEYPLPSGSDWQIASPAYPRPSFVPTIVPGAPAVYQYWKSAYPAAMVLDTNVLAAHLDMEQFFRYCASAFPLKQRSRAPTHTEEMPHPFSAISPDLFIAAADSFSDPPLTRWNRLSITASKNTTSALILMRPYPGWTIQKTPAGDFLFNSLCSVFWSVEIGSGYGNLDNIDLVYAPYSFRFGLFVSLLSAFICAQTLFTRRCRNPESQKGFP